MPVPHHVSRALASVVIALFTLPLLAAEPGAAKDSKPAPANDDPALPRVLLIGDSISIGYTEPTRALLKGVANVHRIAGNGGTTANGVAKLDEWLGGDAKWDAIHLNFGLHDIKQSDGGKDAQPYPGGRQVAPEQYEKNLRDIVARLKKTGAKLVWATTTPVPEAKQNPPRDTADVVAYNAIAKRVMEENGVAMDDLYAVALPRVAEIQKKANVHFTDEGSKLLAESVANTVRNALMK